MRHLLSVVVVSALVPAQEALVRVAHPGRVLAADGTPVGGAAVTMVSVERDLVDGGPDIVRVEADDKGRFRAQVLPTCGYRLWATRPAGEGVEVSTLGALSLPSSELRFAADGHAAATKLRIRGADNWSEFGKLRVRIQVAGSTAFVPEQDVAADGTIDLAPYAPVDVEAFVFCGAALVHHAGIGGSSHLELPPPHRVRAVVVDGGGKPVGDARIERIAATWLTDDGPFPVGMTALSLPVATSDAEGKVDLLLAHRGDPFAGVGYPPLAFVATAKGMRSATAGFTQGVFSNKTAVAAGAERELRFELGAAAATAITVQHAGPTVTVEFAGMHTMPDDQNSSTSMLGRFTVLPAHGGGVGLPPTFQPQLACVRGALPQLAADDPFRRSFAPHPMYLGVQPDGTFACDLALVQPLCVQWIDASGGPAMGAQLVCLPLDGAQYWSGARPALADAAGRIVLTVVPGHYYLCAVRGDEWAGQEVEVAAGQGPVTIRLQKLDCARYRVVDDNGKPIDGARFFGTGAGWTNGPGIVDDFLCTLGNQIANWQLGRATSDAEGRATIPFLALRQQRIDFEVGIGERRTGDLRLRASEGEVVDIVVK